MRESEPDATTLEARAFLQYRVARFGFVTGCLFLGFLAFRVAFGLATAWAAAIEGLGDPDTILHLLAGLSMLAVWGACRGGQRSARFSRSAEAFGLLALAVTTAGMGAFVPWYFRPDYVVTMALAIGLFARAIYVPSTAARSAMLGTLSGLIVVATVFVSFSHGIATHPVDLGVPLEGAPFSVAASTAVWWVLIIVVTTLASRVIYGLRRVIHETKKLGQYQLLEELGHGAMGVVYRASHAMLRRDTAIKLLKTDVATDEDIERFEQEVRLTAKLTHPNTVTIFDFGRTPEGIFYYAMELLEGADLQRVVDRNGAQSAGRVAKILYEAASALAEAHDIGLVHRDIKPANIMLCEQGGQLDVTKVVDFGLVRHVDVDEPSSSSGPVIVGTPCYMAPESFTGSEKAEARSDIYALGAVAYFMLTGEMVFEMGSIAELYAKHAMDAPVPPSERRGEAVDADLERLVLDCLEKSPDDRPQSALELQRRAASLSCFGTWSAEDAERWWSVWRSAESEAEIGNAPTHLGAAPTDIGSAPTQLGTAPTDIGSAPTELGVVPIDLGYRRS